MTDCDSDSFALYGASPNPSICTASVNLVFSLPVESFTDLRVYDLSGRTVFSENNEYTPGTHELIIKGLASGVYLVQMTSEDFTATQNFVVLR